VNLLTRLSPDPASVRLDTWAIEPARPAITLTLRPRSRTAPCPLCGRRSGRVHSRYERTLADLPWGDHAVLIRLQARRLFCDNAGCERRIFAERLSGIAAPWARRTARLATRQTAIGLALGGAAGARLSRALLVPAARNTLLRLVRAAPAPPEVAPSVLGVDDWALRKRHSYGTVLIDLERRRPVALLPDREAGTLARWLRDHPGVAIVARDRAGAYADGTRRGAPGAVQVADRFHRRSPTASTAGRRPLPPLAEPGGDAGDHLHGARRQPAGGRAGGASSGTGRPGHGRPACAAAAARAKAAERRARRLARYRQVWRLHREGWPGHAIARHLGLGRSTVVRYLRHETFPERKGRGDAGRSLLDPWKPLLLERWNAGRRDGRRDGRRLFGELQGRGYRGSYATLARYTQRLRQAQEGAAPRRPSRKRPSLPPVVDPPGRPLTPRTAAWLALRRPGRRDPAGAERLARLRDRDPKLAEAMDLAEEFAALLRAREPERLDPWLARARDGPLPAFRGFAESLATDEAAVRAAATLPWSTGPVEGQINRLKTLKRQMYGRAKLDLLGQRFLLAA
jgi:transposase